MKKTLKIIIFLLCFSLNAQKSNQQNIKGSNSKNKKVNYTITYIYYTFLETGNSIPKIDFFGNIVPPEHSKMYSISNCTKELQNSLEFCLIKNYKEINGKAVVLVPHLLFDRDLLLQKWIKEEGNTFSSPMCLRLMEFGIIEQ